MALFSFKKNKAAAIKKVLLISVYTNITPITAFI